MSEAIIISLISSLCVAIPSILTTISSNKKSIALTNYKIDELTVAVKEHNNFAKRMPVVEEKIIDLTRRVESIERK